MPFGSLRFGSASKKKAAMNGRNTAALVKIKTRKIFRCQSKSRQIPERSFVKLAKFRL